MPSFAPNTDARSQPVRPVRCRSLWRTNIPEDPLDLKTARTGRTNQRGVRKTDLLVPAKVLGGASKFLVSKLSLDDANECLATPESQLAHLSGCFCRMLSRNRYATCFLICCGRLRYASRNCSRSFPADLISFM